MNRDQLKRLLIEVLTAIQTNSGRPVPEFTDDLRPLQDLEGFDSLNGEEAATALSISLGFELPSDLFVHRKRALSLRDVIERILATMPAPAGVSPNA